MRSLYYLHLALLAAVIMLLGGCTSICGDRSLVSLHAKKNPTSLANPTLEGTIKDKLGEPLLGATLFLVETEKNVLYKSSTDLNGSFAFDPVPASQDYLLVATCPGFDPLVIQRLTLGKGDAVRLAIRAGLVERIATQ